MCHAEYRMKEAKCQPRHVRLKPVYEMAQLVTAKANILEAAMFQVPVYYRLGITIFFCLLKILNQNFTDKTPNDME